MKVLVKYLKGGLRGRLDIMDYGSAHTAEKHGVIKIIKQVNKLEVVRKNESGNFSKL